MFGNLGLGEILIILVLILVLFGPNKIPELAGTVGRFINTFRRQMDEAQRAVIDPLRADLQNTLQPPSNGGAPLGGYTLGGGYTPPPPAYVPPPAPLTEEEERARQPKRLLD